MTVSPETHALLWKTFTSLTHAVEAQTEQVRRKKEGYDLEVATLERKQSERTRMARDLARLGITGPACETI